MSAILESFINLIQKLSVCKDNTSICREMIKKYKPIYQSKNDAKKKSLSEQIETSLKASYPSQRESILDRDFSFVTVGTIVIDGYDISTLYSNMMCHDNDSEIKAVTNELLFMFSNICTDEDRKSIFERFAKKPAKQAQKVGVDDIKKVTNKLPEFVDTFMKKNKNLLKDAEKNPKKLTEIMTTMFSNNAGEFASMLNGIVGDIGAKDQKH